MYTIEQIKKIEPTATDFKEYGESIIVSTDRGQVLISKVLVESKKTKTYECLTCGKPITLKRNPNANYGSWYPKRWLKFNLDGSEHTHKRGE